MKALVYATLLAMSFVSASYAQGPRGKGGQVVQAPLTVQEVSDLTYMREEEKLAHDLYVSLDERWTALVFENIAQSETQHFDMLGNALDRYGISDPALPEAGTFTNPDLQTLYNDLLKQGQVSLSSALMTGALVEEADISDLDVAIAETSHTDLQTTYARLQCGSRNHLRAFVRNLEMAGVAYEAQYLTQEQVDAILASSMERCGQTN